MNNVSITRAQKDAHVWQAMLVLMPAMYTAATPLGEATLAKDCAHLANKMVNALLNVRAEDPDYMSVEGT